MKSYVFSFLFLLTEIGILNCGLFHRGLPKKGEFCYVLAKPPTCLFADFEKRKLFYNEGVYDLTLRTRTEYTFQFKDQIAEFLVSTENRIDLKFPGEAVNKFYMRKKEKFSQFPESK